MHFAVTGNGGQRHAVEVVAHDVLACGQGLRAVLVGAHAGGNHLAQFLAAGQGQAVGRVTVFFQLGGQGAAAGALPGQVQQPGHLRPGCLGEARPVHRRVGLWLGRVEQVAVLDEQQAVDHHRRDRGEVLVRLLGIGELIQRRGAAVADRQAGLDFFGVGHEQAVLGIAHQRRGKTHLALDQVIALEQTRQELIEGAVTQAFVEGPIAGIHHGIAGTGLDPIAQGRGQAAQFAGLPVRGAHFALGEKNRSDQRDHQQQPHHSPPVRLPAGAWWQWLFIPAVGESRSLGRTGLP